MDPDSYVTPLEKGADGIDRRSVGSIGDAPDPYERTGLSRRASRRQQKAWQELVSPESAIRGRLAGHDYSTAKHAEQIVAGAFGTRGKKYNKHVGAFIQDHGMDPTTAVARFMEHGHLGTPSEIEYKGEEY